MLQLRRSVSYPFASADARPERNAGVDDALRAGALGLVAVALSLRAPVLALCVLLVAIAVPFRAHRSMHIAVSAGLVAVFAWMNAEKRVDGDWVWYSTHFGWLQSISLNEYLGHHFGYLYIKPTEPLYYTLAYVVSRLSGGSVATLACVITIAIYGSLSLALTCTWPVAQKAGVAGVATLLALAAGVTFTLTTQLVRQEIAGALVLLGATCCWRGRYRWGVAVLGCGVLVHNSAVVLAAIVLAACLVREHTFERKAFLVIAAAVTVAGGITWSHLAGGDADYGTRSDGHIAKSVYLLDVVIFLAFLASSRRLEAIGHIRDCVRRTVLLYGGFLAGVLTLPIPFLRMYFYVEDLRVFMICCIVAAWGGGKHQLLKLPLLVIAAVAYVELRMAHSPFIYGGGLVEHLLHPLS